MPVSTFHIYLCTVLLEEIKNKGDNNNKTI